jgi:hypothetical protein
VKSKLALLLIVVASTGSLAVSVPGQEPPQPPDQPAPPISVSPAASVYAPTPPDPALAPPVARYSISSAYGISGAQTHEEANLTHKATDLAKRLGAGKSDDDRDKLKSELASVLEKQFDLRQKRHQKEIDSLEAQVKKLKNLFEKRQENRREIIAKRLEQILREADGLGW